MPSYIRDGDKIGIASIIVMLVISISFDFWVLRAAGALVTLLLVIAIFVRHYQQVARANDNAGDANSKRWQLNDELAQAREKLAEYESIHANEVIANIRARFGEYFVAEWLEGNLVNMCRLASEFPEDRQTAALNHLVECFNFDAIEYGGSIPKRILENWAARDGLALVNSYVFSTYLGNEIPELLKLALESCFKDRPDDLKLISEFRKSLHEDRMDISHFARHMVTLKSELPRIVARTAVRKKLEHVHRSYGEQLLALWDNTDIVGLVNIAADGNIDGVRRAFARTVLDAGLPAYANAAYHAKADKDFDALVKLWIDSDGGTRGIIRDLMAALTGLLPVDIDNMIHWLKLDANRVVVRAGTAAAYGRTLEAELLKALIDNCEQIIQIQKEET